MLFLVTGENIDAGYLLPPNQAMEAVEAAVAPSFQQLAELERSGALRGGLFPGERAGAFVVEVESFVQLDELMNRLPFFGLVKWQVKPLMPFSTAAAQTPKYVARVREQLATMGGS